MPKNLISDLIYLIIILYEEEISMRKGIRILCLATVVIMLLSMLLAGCSKSNQSTTETTVPSKAEETVQAEVTENTAPDTSKEVKLTGYLMGSAPTGMSEVMVELNKKLKSDINATMEINYIGWGDWQSKYPLVLASGEGVDWIYTSNWCFYFQEAARGAFYEITEDDFNKYMPKYAAALSSDGIKQTLHNGKMYMIPTATPDTKIFAALIRGDLRKKYGIPEIKKFSEIEPYLEAVKKNETSLIPMNLEGNQDIYVPYASYLAEKDAYYIDILSSGGSGSGLTYKVGDSSGKLFMPNDEPLQSNAIQAAEVMKSWYDKGYFNKNVFANKVLSKDTFVQGKSAVAFGNSVSLQSTIADASSKGWEPEIITLLDSQGHYRADPYINNGFAIAANSQNPERTMMAMDLISQDQSYNYLVYYGIEGKNYIVKDGKIDLPEGLAADKNTYPADAAGFWFTNKNQFKPMATWNAQYIQLLSDIKEKGYLINDSLVAFNADISNIKTEIANLNQVGIQYMNPIYVGMVKDIKGAFDLRNEKLKAANIDKVKEELQKQVNVYLNK